MIFLDNKISVNNQLSNTFSVENFHKLIKRERYLSDRNNSGFSLIVFNVRNDVCNDEQITKARLADRDVVTVGKHTLFISLQDGRDATREFAEATIRVAPKTLSK